jgi:hypothetical protein
MPRDDRTPSTAVLRYVKALDPGLLVVGLLVLLAVSPLFPAGLPNIADAPIHLFRTMELVSCWKDGVYFPRWAPNLAFGYGYPLFDFAPPLPYFIAGALHVIGFSLETSIELLAMLCMAAYGFGMYLFARNILGRRGALLAAGAYVYAPFRFREVLLYGGNYPQILAIGLFPWVLWTFERIVADGRRRYVLAGALSYAALILSHNFHAFIFTPLLILYIAALLCFRAARSHPAGATGFLKVLLRPAPFVALLLGLGLTAFFWGPALHDLKYTAARQDYYLARSDFSLRLLSVRDFLAFPVPLDRRADNPYVPFSLGTAVLLLAGMGVAYLLLRGLWRVWLIGRQHKKGAGVDWETLHLAFFLLVSLGACFMMLRPASLLWERLPFLPYAEFPWRLMGMANLSLALLAGGSIRWWERDAPLRKRGFLTADVVVAVSLLALVLGVASYFYPTRFFLKWGTPTLSDYIQYEVRTQNVGTTGLAEYLPRWAEEIPTSSPLVDSMREGRPVEKLDWSILSPGVRATPLSHTAISDRYRFISETGFRARFLTFYFPGWRATIDGKPIQLDISSASGLMMVNVPAGDHELVLRFGETPFRLGMDLISAAVLGGMLVWLVGGLWAGAEKGRKTASGPGGPSLTGSSPRLGMGYGVPGLLLVILLVAKIAVIDPHTDWFRRESPPGQVLGAQHPMHVRLDDNVVFLGYDLVGPGRVRPGGLLQVRLYWQATGPVKGDYMSFVHLDAPPDNTTFVSGDNYHPGDPQAQNDVPSLQWSSDLYVRDEHRLSLPKRLLPIAYTLQAGLYERESGRRLSILPDQADGQSGDTIRLNQIRVMPTQSPHIALRRNQQTYYFGDSIELLGYHVEVAGSEGDRLQPETIGVTLTWRALAPVGSYTVFVHLLDDTGRLRSQHDSPPMNGRYPTQNWLAHQIIEDHIDLPLTPDLPPGEYRIVVGMYEPTTGQRLMVRSDEGPLPNNVIPLEPALRLGD